MGRKAKLSQGNCEFLFVERYSDFDGIKNSNKIYDLLRLIALQIGKEVSLQELGNQLQMSKNTVERYLDLLTKVLFCLK